MVRLEKVSHNDDSMPIHVVKKKNTIHATRDFRPVCWHGIIDRCRINAQEEDEA